MTPEQNRERQRKYREKNRALYNERARIRQAKWRRENPNGERAACARWVKAHPEKHKARQVRWAKANPGKVAAKAKRDRERNPEKHREWGRRYRRENPHKLKQFAEARRSRENAAPGRGVTSENWSYVLTQSLGLCAYCCSPRRLEMDHIDALASGGEHDPDNIAASCGRCNKSKGKQRLLVWLVGRAS